MEQKIDKIEAFFNGLDNIMNKYPIIERLIAVLFLIGGICWILWYILRHIIASIVWMVTGTMELCLIPVYCLTWLLFGKFPMFEIHEFVLKKLNLFDLIYKKIK